MITSRAEAEEAVKRIAHLTALLGVRVAVRDKELQGIREKHTALIETLSAQISEEQASVQAWADAHRAQEFGEAQSLELSHGYLRYRLGNRKLELRSGWTWPKVLSKLLGFDLTSQWAQYVKREPEIDVQRILRDCKGDKPVLPPARLKIIGCKVDREERFHVEPKPEMVTSPANPPL